MITSARITDDWLPVPLKVLTALGWKDGDILTLEPVGNALLVTRLDAADDPQPAPSPRTKK